MTAKEYLSKIQTYRQTMQMYADRIEELYHEAAGIKAIVYDKDRVQVSPENRFEQIMAKIDAEARKWARARLRYEKEVRKRMEQVAGLERADYAEILRLRYVDISKDGRPLTLEQIACTMHLSFYRVAHLHGEALQAFDRKYNVSKQ